MRIRMFDGVGDPGIDVELPGLKQEGAPPYLINASIQVQVAPSNEVHVGGRVNVPDWAPKEFINVGDWYEVKYYPEDVEDLETSSFVPGWIMIYHVK